MKIKKIIACLVFAILSAAAISFAGCSDGYEVTVNKMSGDTVQSTFTLTVPEGEGVKMGTLAEQYPDEFGSDTGFWCDDFFYTDKACTAKYTDKSVAGNITLYYGTYNPAVSHRIAFVYGDGEYVIYRADNAVLSADAFSRSAYGYGEATDYSNYLDEGRKTSVDITQLSLGSDDERSITIYVFDA